MSVLRNANGSTYRWKGRVLLAIVFMATYLFNFFNASYLMNTHFHSRTSASSSMLSDYKKEQTNIHNTNVNVTSPGKNNQETWKKLSDYKKEQTNIHNTNVNVTSPGKNNQETGKKLSDYKKEQKNIHNTNVNVTSPGKINQETKKNLNRENKAIDSKHNDNIQNRTDKNNQETKKNLNGENKTLSFAIDSKHNDNIQNRTGNNNQENGKNLNGENKTLSFAIDSKHDNNVQNHTSAATSGETHQEPKKLDLGKNLRKASKENWQSFDEDLFFSNLAYSSDANHPTADFITQDAFSASWWQSKDRFLEYVEVEKKSPSPEGASFEIFKKKWKHMRVTRDWMNLNVEHMSKWWKVILNKRYGNEESHQKYLPRVIGIFKDYVYSADRSFFWKILDETPDNAHDWLEVSQSTIAVIAFMPVSGPGGESITTWSLAATLMSLVQLGVGHVVISGVESDEDGQRIVQEAWTEIANATRDWPTSERKQMTTFAFCNCGNTTHDPPNEHRPPNIPKTALRRLRHVFLKKVDENLRECWGGPYTSIESDVMDRWQYVFLGEPDLILNIRPSVIAKLGKALKDGGILAPHRLQPLPHDSNFGATSSENELKFFIPNVPPKLDDVIEIDHYKESSSMATERYNASEVISCCDDGNQKPYKQFEDCGNWWWECGYHIIRTRIRKDKSEEHINVTFATEAHKRVALYPFVKLKRGTGVVFAGSEHGRRCLPSNGTCRRSS